jgi:outer membrane protein OmpA-like peptidoglycan-associated protein/LysM repeat protein
MNLKKYLLFAFSSGLSFLYSCSCEKETKQDAPPVVITNNDIEQAKELILPNPVTDTTWLIDSSNIGFGQRQDFNADSALVRHLYATEENTDWYKFVAPTDTSLAITVEPNDPSAEYDMVVFRSTGDSTGPDLRKGIVPAIRSNFARISKPEDTITGLYCDHRLAEHVPSDSIHQFSKAFWIQTGETYYVVLNTNTGKGKGYKLRMHSCAPGEAGPKHHGTGSAGSVAGQTKPGPEILSFTPETAGKGKTVTISGNHFEGTTVVSFGGVQAQSFQVISDTEIQAVLGSGASGTVEISSPDGSAQKDYFNYVEGKSGQKAASKKSSVKKKKQQPADDGEYYIVKPKDTMFSIAFIFGMTVEEILKLNNLDNTNVFVGQKLRVIRRQLPQKVIEKKISISKPVKPSPPVPGSTTHPVEIAKAKDPVEEPTKAVEPSAPVTPPLVGRNPNFNPTPNFPTNNPVITSGVETKNSLAPADKSFYVYCNVTSGVNKQPVAGTLQVVDLKKKDLVYNVQANRTQAVPLFNAGGKQKLFICDIFGYKKQDFDLNLDNIINDSTAQQVQIVDDTIVINFELRRLEKGDVAVAYNIFFYDDASVMLPKSTYELDQLLELMLENNKIKIKIHGHTNTSKLGKILYLEKGDKTFFRLTAKNKETYGPARLLSKKRAETIKWYLESKRITDDRIQTEGHGGSQMLYPNTHPLAFKNKRVEVEILEDK